MIGYKLTDQRMQTYNNTQWQIGEWKETHGEGDLCSPGWLHYYSDPLLAVFLNPIHANFAEPRLFEAEISGETKEDFGLKFGCTRMRLVKELELPIVTKEQRAKFAILCALEILTDPASIRWANNWLDGTDRSAESAKYTKDVAQMNGIMTTHSIYWTYQYLVALAESYCTDEKWQPYRCAKTVQYVAYVSYSLGNTKPLDLPKIARKAME